MTVRVARWDLSSVELVRPAHRHAPVHRPAAGQEPATRTGGDASVASGPPPAKSPCRPSGIAPRLAALMQEYAQTGLPPAYLPKDDRRGPDP